MWHVLVPVKSWDTAKSRLTVSAPERRRLAEAMTEDTVKAVTACPQVSETSVVVGDARQVSAPALRSADHVVVQPDPSWDVNASLRWAVEELGLDATPTAVVVGDLPALPSAALEELLTDAAPSDRGLLVPDRHDIGTTALAFPHGGLSSHFGPRSAGRHRTAGLVDLQNAGPGLRCDVDTLVDLRIALDLGVGRCTKAAIVALADSLPWPP